MNIAYEGNKPSISLKRGILLGSQNEISLFQQALITHYELHAIILNFPR